ncbi:glycine--tRNA ligase [Phycicoccus flavus]|uniref:Multifunctional fusion protein n=1 Tax=Phycicoccus flavus TaxID=2502783 RepID=A0A8T6R3P0_9MICO|nr:glycine--tRNA ligase [Phycicoccus flavus]NHA69089.1 glycine--tRNA ligase [Phycicoccus flavus]
MQDAILALQGYWSARGCMIAQPFNTEVGAGTANPATALRVLGPEPWAVGYVEPSVRPDDSRYGENPNRLQTHTQFQVILKPDPGNPQELYLDSLRHIGIDLDAHDVRFVEDNWASPALGAWGLGWEVWLDGMEITQFTYFQQAGGVTLDPVSVEITYGLERILMAVQGVTHFTDIEYAPGITYGEVFAQSEYEMSRYYLDDADLDTNRALFDRFAAEARRLVDLGLPVPAYTYVLKCSHTFNVLDARGAISTTDRAASFRTMRDLTREVAHLWLRRREELGLPLGRVEPLPPATAAGPVPVTSGPATALLEIGTEELPPAEVAAAAEQLRESVTAGLDASLLGHGEVRVATTPRRLVLTVADVQPVEPGTTKVDRGPRASLAYDADGALTKAGAGFLRSRGAEESQLGRVTEGEHEYVTITRTVEGRSAGEVLTGVLGDAVRSLRSSRNMRWNDPELTFSRPIRWLVALLGTEVLPVIVSSLAAGRTTRVLRTAAQAEVDVRSADEHATLLLEHDVVLDRQSRRQQIVDGAHRLATTAGGRVDLDAVAATVEEVTDLVEKPTPVLGRFEDRYMQVPSVVLVTVMRKHQRYLPVVDDDGALLPSFVAVANGSCDEDTVRAGNEAVLRARFEDAAFFYEADRQETPQDLYARLDRLTFETRLGSVADRSRRIATLATTFAERAEADPDVRATVQRAGAIAKFDLTSQMVVELSSLAGVMAEVYALEAGEPAEVATALREMEMPRQGAGDLPTSTAGALLSVADRLDLLTGMLAVGNVPTGQSDPFGVRRAATGAVRVLRSVPELGSLDLLDGVTAAADLLRAQGVEVSEETVGLAVSIAVRRYEQQLLEDGHAVDDVRAVLPLATRPGVADAVLAELEQMSGRPDFEDTVFAVQRATRILPSTADVDVSAPSVLDGDADRALEAAVTRLESPAGPSLAALVAAADGLRPVVDTFFEEVRVMDDDAGVRAARVLLLRRLDAATSRVLDWSQLSSSAT